MLPSFGLRDKVFIILLVSSTTSMFIYKITVACALVSQNIVRFIEILFKSEYLQVGIYSAYQEILLNIERIFENMIF
jgi:hypothetical protein